MGALDPTFKTSTADSTGDIRFEEFVGYAEFELEGQKLKLYAMKSGQSLFLPFTDRTAPKETYGGGRFLYAPAPVNGSITLDFNAKPLTITKGFALEIPGRRSLEPRRGRG
jgi:uncharacterized protein (DUF1684 family)